VEGRFLGWKMKCGIGEHCGRGVTRVGSGAAAALVITAQEDLRIARVPLRRFWLSGRDLDKGTY